MSLTIDDYDASPEELAALELHMRRRAAADAKIDLERLSVKVETVIVITGYEMTPFVRPDRAIAKLDGEDLPPYHPVNNKLLWYLSRALLGTRFPVDPSHVRVRDA